jgi:hypothetical protein
VELTPIAHVDRPDELHPPGCHARPCEHGAVLFDMIFEEVETLRAASIVR